MRILHTMLRVGDLPRSIDFYTRVLGMQLLRTTDRPEQKYRLAFVGYGDESAGAVLELTYNYDVPSYDSARASDTSRSRWTTRRRRCAAVRAAAARRGHARRGSGEGRHDGHRVRAGPRRLQDRADRAPKSAVEPARVGAPSAARGDALTISRVVQQLAQVVREHVGVLPVPTYRRSRPCGSNMNVPAEWSIV